MNLIEFAESVVTDKQLMESIRMGYGTLFEEPYVFSPGKSNESLMNIFSEDDLRVLCPQHPSLQETDVRGNLLFSYEHMITELDAYFEQDGTKRLDGKTHDGLQYIMDIANGVAAIGPRDNVVIKLNPEHGKRWLSWIYRTPYTMRSVVDYILKRGIGCAKMLPMDVYLNAIHAGHLGFIDFTKIMPDCYENDEVMRSMTRMVLTSPNRAMSLTNKFYREAFKRRFLTFEKIAELLPRPKKKD